MRLPISAVTIENMGRDEAQAAIIRDWLALAPEERATKLHAEMFAMSKVGEYRFRTKASEDKREIIKGWLLEAGLTAAPRKRSRKAKA